MAYKICRALPIQLNEGVYPVHIARLMYEFFCYCIQGGASPTTPVGLAPTTPQNFPANTFEGTSVLSTGTDGVTSLASQNFTSASPSTPFSTSMVGKHLVMWKPGSGDTNDSIYPIVGFTSPNEIQIDFTRGGNPDSITLHPSIRARTGINYRVIDMTYSGPVGTNSYTHGQYIVFQLTPQNAGQANSQVQFIFGQPNNSSSWGSLVGSPAGTWSGSAFSDGMSAVAPVSNGGGYTNGGGNPQLAFITMMGDTDGLVAWFKGGETSAGYIHFEAPLRIATQVQDPNPLVIATDGVSGLYTSSFGAGYNNHWMAGTDGTARRHRLLTKSLHGDGSGYANTVPTTIIGQQFGDTRFSQNAVRGLSVLGQVLMAQIGAPATQFVLARALLRYVRMCPAAFPVMTRFTNPGQWIHIENGICFPWDNMIWGSTLALNGY
jgi:hypothetical protein